MDTILLLGTYDTKLPELKYLSDCLKKQGVTPLLMDVSILETADIPIDIDQHAVARAANKTLHEIATSGDENSAMTLMAQGASALAKQLCSEGKINGLLALGGSMGTDLALDVAKALPLGVPKYIISTIAFSPLIPADRLSPDLQMILWAGGLYGLNDICRASLSQAAGAVAGACRAVEIATIKKPLIGITSLGSSCLNYMIKLKPALEQRGFEIAIFHATGMGGRAFESFAAEGAFVAVMDFCPQEIANHLHGSSVHAGADRMENAGKNNIPQLIAPGCMDLVDFPASTPLPDKFSKCPYHVHNRLLSSVVLDAQSRRQNAALMSKKLATASAKTHIILPLAGIEEWDKPHQPAHDPAGLAAFMDELQNTLPTNVEKTLLDAHINDDIFAETALAIFDEWCAGGIISIPSNQREKND